MAAVNSSSKNNSLYYDTLEELNHDADNLIEHDFDVPVSKSIIANIFANHKSIHDMKPSHGKRPILIITAGSPGVGKSTIAKHQFERFGVDPNKVYTVSMDMLLEHNRLFRTETKKLYEKLLHQKGAPFNNSNYATFSGLSTSAYAARQANLKIPEKIAEINEKLGTKFSEAMLTNNTIESAFKKLRLNNKSIKNNKSKKSSTRKSTSKKMADLINLDQIRNIGFEYGVKHGLNILYDSTLSEDRMNTIMNTLREYKMVHKYEIKILLIKADEESNQAVAKIQQRIMGRHLKMVENGFLRALTTNPKVIKSMINSNKKGYNKARNTYKNNGNTHNSNNSRYTAEDFYFEEIINP